MIGTVSFYDAESDNADIGFSRVGNTEEILILSHEIKKKILSLRHRLNYQKIYFNLTVVMK